MPSMGYFFLVGYGMLIKAIFRRLIGLGVEAVSRT